jgi:hypothetical protein
MFKEISSHNSFLLYVVSFRDVMNNFIQVKDRESEKTVGTAYKRAEILAYRQRNQFMFSNLVGSWNIGEQSEDVLRTIFRNSGVFDGFEILGGRAPVDIVFGPSKVGVADIKYAPSSIIHTNQEQRLVGVFIVIDGAFNVGVYSFQNVNDLLVDMAEKLLKKI